jgi:hypothetical protein
MDEDRIETDEIDDAERLLLLDRMAERLPEIDLDNHQVSWTQMPDGHRRWPSMAAASMARRAAASPTPATTST